MDKVLQRMLRGWRLEEEEDAMLALQGLLRARETSGGKRMDWMEDDGQRWVAACRKKKMGSPGLLERPEMEGRKTDWMEDDG